MKRILLGLLLISVAVLAQAQQDQDQEQLWMPEGYRLLTIEERQALPPAELQAIGARNQELLRAAVKAMSREERQKLAASLESYRNRPDATQVEKQYVTMAAMLLMATVIEEDQQKTKQAAQDRLQALIREQDSRCGRAAAGGGGRVRGRRATSSRPAGIAGCCNQPRPKWVPGAWSSSSGKPSIGCDRSSRLGLLNR
jgi:hypothetical protein